MPKYYTVKEVADILGYSTNSVYTFLKEKRIKGIRVGKGRFRIPEEELTWILHLSKRPAEALSVSGGTSVVPVASSPVVPVAETSVQTSGTIPWYAKRLSAGFIVRANIFDWFIGLGAMVAGAGLFLFNQSNVVQGGLIKPYLSAARVMLITVGVGVVVSNIFEGLHPWRRVFYILLTLLSLGSVWSLARIQDYDGAILYGSMGLLVAVNAVYAIDGIMSILFYMTLLLVSAVIVLFFGADVAHVQAFSALFSLPNYLVAVFFTLIGGINMIGYWIGYRQRSVWFRICAWISAVISFGAAVWYGNMEYWSRAMYFVVLGFFNLITPLWPMIANRNQSRKDHATIHIFLGLVSIVIFMTVFAVYQLQHMLWVQKTAEFHNKMMIAQRLLVRAFDTAQGVLTTTALNQDLVTAVKKKDLTVINQYAKVLYQSHSYIRRIIVLSSEGQGIALYPYGTFDQTNLAFRDYFITVRNTRKPYISGVFESSADNAHRQVVTVTVPLVTAIGDFAGVLSASIDLDAVNMELQQIANEEKGEIFSVMDKKGQRVLTPDMTLVGTQVPQDDPIRLGLKTFSSGTKETIEYNSQLGVVAYNVLPQLGWTVRLRAPVGSVVVINDVAILSILGAIMAILVVATWAFYCLYIHPKESGGNSP